MNADNGFERWVVHHRVEALNDVFVWLSRVGSSGAIWLVLAAVLALAWRRWALLWTIPVVLCSDGIAEALKVAVDRPRPHADPLVAVPSSPAFPSGHTTTAFAGAAMLTASAPRAWPLWYLLAAAIGWSRLYLGVHWPFDVAAGAVLGTLVALTALRLLARFRLRPRTAPPRARSTGRRPGRSPGGGPPAP